MMVIGYVARSRLQSVAALATTPGRAVRAEVEGREVLQDGWKGGVIKKVVSEGGVAGQKEGMKGAVAGRKEEGKRDGRYVDQTGRKEGRSIRKIRREEGVSGPCSLVRAELTADQP